LAADVNMWMPVFGCVWKKMPGIAAGMQCPACDFCRAVLGPHAEYA